MKVSQIHLKIYPSQIQILQMETELVSQIEQKICHCCTVWKRQDEQFLILVAKDTRREMHHTHLHLAELVQWE